MEEKFLKVTDIANVLGCSIKKAYSIVRQEDFPKITIGRQYYIPCSAFNRWIKNYTGKEFQLN